MHEAIQLITKTLATHLPAHPTLAAVVVKEMEVASMPIPVAEPISEPVAQESVAQEPAVQEPKNHIQAEPTPLAPSDEITPIPSSTPSTAATITPDAVPASPKSTVPNRPTHVKRGSVIGSIGKFLWPFGGTAAPPKEASVQVSTVDISGEVEVQKATSSSKDNGSTPGPELTKVVSTVEVTEVLATPMAV